MKAKSRSARYMFNVIWILLAVLGVYIANRTYQYEIVVKGILGFAVLYLLYFYLKFPGVEVSVDTMLSDPKIYKHFIYALIGPGLAYLATGGIFDMISSLVKTWLGL